MRSCHICTEFIFPGVRRWRVGGSQWDRYRAPVKDVAEEQVCARVRCASDGAPGFRPVTETLCAAQVAFHSAILPTAGRCKQALQAHPSRLKAHLVSNIDCEQG